MPVGRSGVGFITRRTEVPSLSVLSMRFPFFKGFPFLDPVFFQCCHPFSTSMTG